MSKSISIIGCGWLGLPLAKKCLDLQWKVKGTSTRAEKVNSLRELGIEAYQYNTSGDIPPEAVDAKYLILNIPPGRNDDARIQQYETAIQSILSLAAKSNRLKKVIFVSSTSVYGDEYDVIDENTECLPASASGNVLLKSELTVKQSKLPYIILRFGGLAGPGRHPGRFLAGRTLKSSGKQVVNFLHLLDAIYSIIHVLERDIKNETYNVVAPIHPTKEEFYQRMTAQINQPPPIFDETKVAKRREISSNKIQDQAGYHFEFPDPVSFTFQ